MKIDDLTDRWATIDQVRLAIEELSKEDIYRLRKAAAICLDGTEYQDPQEIINEALVRTMNAANGGNGRRWPIEVPFIAYMIQTLKGLASDSRDSADQAKTDRLEAIARDDSSVEDALGRLEHHHADALTLATELEESSERQERAREVAERIDARFAGDSEVMWLIMGRKEGMSAAEIRKLAEMTETQYNTALRRFRRGLEKLFPGRRAS